MAFALVTALANAMMDEITPKCDAGSGTAIGGWIAWVSKSELVAIK